MDIDNSTLERYQACLRRGWFYNKLKREPNVASPALISGKAVHAGFESFFRLGNLSGVREAVFDSWGNQPITDYRTPDLAVAVVECFARENPSLPWRFLSVDGAPWIERSFSVPILPGINWTGRLDGVCQFPSGDWGPLDLKTTSRAGESWWESWDNAQQFLGYAWALSQIVGRLPTMYAVAGFAARKPTATGTGIEYLGTRTWPIQRWQIEEWEANTITWIRQIEALENEDQATMNRFNCIGKYGACPYKKVCDLAPSHRHPMLATNLFKDVTWSPLT